jgi:hypothetical protein
LDPVGGDLFADASLWPDWARSAIGRAWGAIAAVGRLCYGRRCNTLAPAEGDFHRVGTWTPAKIPSIRFRRTLLRCPQFDVARALALKPQEHYRGESFVSIRHAAHP